MPSSATTSTTTTGAFFGARRTSIPDSSSESFKISPMLSPLEELLNAHSMGCAASAAGELASSTKAPRDATTRDAIVTVVSSDLLAEVLANRELAPRRTLVRRVLGTRETSIRAAGARAAGTATSVMGRVTYGCVAFRWFPSYFQFGVPRNEKFSLPRI